jgi:hypothetical protein
VALVSTICTIFFHDGENGSSDVVSASESSSEEDMDVEICGVILGFTFILF